MSRQDQSLLTVMVDGQDLGVFDKKSGGEVDSDEVKYKPGAMGDELALGGPRTVSNVTVSRLYRLDRDHALAKQMQARVGRAPMSVSEQPLDTDGNVFGAPVVMQGILKRVKFPERDSESSSAALLEIEMSTAGSVG